MNPSETLHSTAHYFLEALSELGFDYLFCNFGTDHAPLIEEMARWRRLGRAAPQTVLCPHENTAVHKAAGYAIATGRGQGVFVHVDAGTANAAMALHNLFRARLPVMLMAGRAPYTLHGELTGSRDNYVHFVQDPFDQASVVRPYVKWEYNLPSGVVAKEALRRAHSVMQSDPKGPVYFMFPRETLTESWPESAIRSFPAARYGPALAGGADPEVIAGLADRLLAAERPLLITAYAGRNPATAVVLDQLARFAGIRVIEPNPIYLNIAHDSPCFGGHAVGQHVAEADVGVLLDVDVPWIPRDTPDNAATYWAHIDVDVIKRSFPMWGFPSLLRVQGDSARILAQLLDAMRMRATPELTHRAQARVDALATERDARAKSAAALAAEPGARGAINPHFVCAALGRALAADDVVLNEAIRNTTAVLAQIPRTQPGTLLGLAGGGLGFSGGMALGIKLAQPARAVVQIIGDGTFYFSNPASVYAVAKQYGLPIVTIVLDNSGWAAVKEATLRVYPGGEASDAKQYESRLATGMEFAKIVEAAGGYGESVDDPDAVEAAIARVLAAARGGRAALLHVRVTPL